MEIDERFLGIVNMIDSATSDPERFLTEAKRKLREIEDRVNEAAKPPIATYLRAAWVDLTPVRSAVEAGDVYAHFDEMENCKPKIRMWVKQIRKFYAKRTE